MVNQKKVWNTLYKEKRILWKKETSNLPKILKGKKVLELGVGNGKTLISILKQKPKQVIAIDFSDEVVEFHLKKFPQVQIIQEDIKNLPFKDKEFDAIVCYFVLDSLLQWEIELAVAEIFRVLKKKCKVLFCDFAAGDFRQDGKELETNTMLKKNGLICHFFTKKEVKKLFKKFNMLKIEEKTSCPISHKKHLVRKLVQGIFEKARI